MTRPAPDTVSSSAPVPGIQRVLVERDVRDPRVGVEDVLGAVAVMGVVVDDQHPLAPIGERRGGDRDVVDQAEPHRARRRGVVARRADREEGGVGLAPIEPVDRVEARRRRPATRPRSNASLATVSHVDVAATGSGSSSSACR